MDNPNFTTESTRMYTAAVLNDISVKILKEAAERTLDLAGFEFCTTAGNPLPHHMTINIGPFNTTINDPNLLGEDCVISIREFLICEKIGVCAANVLLAKFGMTNINSTNLHRHITVCLKPPAKPAHSNDLFITEGVRRVEIGHTIHLEARVEEVQ